MAILNERCDKAEADFRAVVTISRQFEPQPPLAPTVDPALFKTLEDDVKIDDDEYLEEILGEDSEDD